MHFRHIVYFLSVIALLLATPVTQAKVRVQTFGIDVSQGTEVINKATRHSFDSLLNVHPLLSDKKIIYGVEHDRPMPDKTADFYFLLFLCALLGLIRLTDPRYFLQLWKAFRNPALSSRQLKEQLENASFSALLTNIFFTMTAGAYIYYLIKLFVPQRAGTIESHWLILMLMGGMMLIYAIKYGVMRFSGWAFKVEGITQHYIFNVFLINKIIGVVLLPFTILLAFADPAITAPALIVSIIIISFLLINRYTRSWQVFGSFFQYSRFHFFMYLCASELLPLAVLVKLLVRGLIY